MDELKPCPFCGSNNGVVLDSPEYVACMVCGFEGVAIEDYNRRPIEDALHAENERLRSALAWYADPENYLTGFDKPGQIVWNVMYEGGERARRALKGGE